MSQIVTGDAVVLDLRPARVPTRMVATVIDLTLMFLLSWGWNKLADLASQDASQRTMLSLVGYFAILLGYPVLWETLTRGRTPGAFAMGLRVMRDDGGTIGFRQALIRGLAFWLVDLSPMTAMLGGLVSATISPDGKRIGDLLAGTLVIRVRAPRLGGTVPLADPALAAWAAQLELSRVTDEQIAASRYALQRAAWLRPKYRLALLFGLASQIARVTTPPPPPGLGPEEYLTTVLGELRRRNAERHTPALGVEIPNGWR